LVIGFWKTQTWTGHYAWNPKGKELLMLDIALSSIFFYKTIFWLVTANLIVFGLLQLRKRKFKTTGILIVLTLTYHFTVGQQIDKKCAVHYYSVFQNQSVAEGLIARPIEKAGYAIGAILTEKLADKDMKYRRYAILGLQKINYQSATKLLGEILFDNSESEYFRRDAYEALKYFDNEKSNQLIRQFREQTKDFSENKRTNRGEFFYKNGIKSEMTFEETQDSLRAVLLKSKPNEKLKSSLLQELYIRGLVDQIGDKITFELPFNLHGFDCGAPDCYSTDISFEIPAKDPIEFPKTIRFKLVEYGCGIEKQISVEGTFIRVEESPTYVNYYAEKQQSNLVILGEKGELYFFTNAKPNAIKARFIDQLFEEFTEDDQNIPYQSTIMTTNEYENFLNK